MSYEILPYNATYGYGQTSEEEQAQQEQWKEIAPMALAALAGNYAPTSSDDIKRAEQALNILKSVQRSLPNISALNDAIATLEGQVARANELYAQDLRREKLINAFIAVSAIGVLVAATGVLAAGLKVGK